MNDICYFSNPITQAIARIDFLNQVDDFKKKKLPTSLLKEIKKYFPVAEPVEKKERQFSFTIQKGSFNKKNKLLEKTVREWIFFTKDRTKKLVITHQCMFVVHFSYEGKDNFHNHFSKIMKAIYRSIPDLQSKRFGMRYINIVKKSKGNPYNWRQYINKNLLSAFNVPDDKEPIARIVSNIELNFDYYMIRFVYGITNPDFPAKIKKHEFLLDFDVYCTGMMDKEEIESCFVDFHKKIQHYFEKSITAKYKAMLNEKV